MKAVSVTIGEFPLHISLPDPSFLLEESYRSFQVPSPLPTGHWEVHPEPIPAVFRYPPEVPPKAQRWEVTRREDKKAFRLWNPVANGYLWKAARMAEDCARGEIWVDRREEQSACLPLFYLDLLLWSHFLLPRGGLVVHASAVKKDDNAYLFPAPAGGGKSTWAELAGGGAGLGVLGEDKVVVRRIAGDYAVFGTPWNPRPEFRSPAGAPLKGIFFLRPASSNAVRSLSSPEVLERLLRTAFLPFPGQADLDSALSRIEDLIQAVPSRRFDFRRDGSAVDFFSSLTS